MCVGAPRRLVVSAGLARPSHLLSSEIKFTQLRKLHWKYTRNFHITRFFISNRGPNYTVTKTIKNTFSYIIFIYILNSHILSNDLYPLCTIKFYTMLPTFEKFIFHVNSRDLLNKLLNTSVR